MTTVIEAGTNGGALMGAKMSGTVVVGPVSGQPQLTWAQNTSSATPTVVKAQSFVALWRQAPGMG